MGYNLNFTDNGNNIVDFLIGANQITDAWLGGVILLILGLIWFIAYNHYDVKDVFVACSYLVVVVGTMMWGIGLIGMNILLWPIIILFFAIIYKIFGGS